jgi:hypothetical protein
MSVRSQESTLICEYLKNVDTQTILNKKRKVSCVSIVYEEAKINVWCDIPDVMDRIKSKYFYFSESPLAIAKDIFVIKHETVATDIAILSPSTLILAKKSNLLKLFFVNYNFNKRILDGGSIETLQDEDYRYLENPSKHWSSSLIDYLFELELLNTIKMQNGCLQFVHASSVAKNEFATIFFGLSKSGKTTLSVALATHGLKLLNDDITCVDISNFYVYDFIRKPRIRFSSLTFLRQLVPDLNLNQLYTSKMLTQNSSVKNEAVKVYKPKNIVFLKGFENKCKLSEISSEQALWSFLDQFIIRPDGFLSKLCFEVSRFIGQSQCYELVIGELTETISLLEGII